MAAVCNYDIVLQIVL